MTKNELLIKLEGLERDIVDRAYIEDWDGDDENGRQIIRLVFNEMTEKDVKYIQDKLGQLINDIIENGIKGVE